MTSASWTVCGDMVADFPRAVGDSTAGRNRLDRTEFAERRRSFLEEPRALYVLKYRWFSGVRDFFCPDSDAENCEFSAPMPPPSQGRTDAALCGKRPRQNVDGRGRHE